VVSLAPGYWSSSSPADLSTTGLTALHGKFFCYQWPTLRSAAIQNDFRNAHFESCPAAEIHPAPPRRLVWHIRATADKSSLSS
jgi:hypothetical protein